MKRELIGSAVVHVVLLLVLILVTTPSASLPPPVPPDQIMNVTPVDAVPKGLLKAPKAEIPGHEADVAESTPAEVAIPEPRAIPVEPPKPKQPTSPKPRPKPAEKPPAQRAEVTPEEPNVEEEPRQEVFESKVQAGAGAARAGSLLGEGAPTSRGRAGTYPDRVVNKIYYTWRNPAKLPDTIRCSVIFRIDPDGRASQVALEESSGMNIFDNSTVRAVYESAPYPPFPRSLRDEYIVMRIIFEHVP